MPNRRYSKESQQEHRSKAQLTDRFTDFGWIPVSPPDFGEDFIVSIYIVGEATGVNFYVQVKSVKNINNIKVNDSIKYRIKVSDLMHWEAFSLPVVLIIWDINSHQGRWILIKDLINNLDLSKPDWRNLKTKTTVYLPWSNTTSDEGLTRMKHMIGMQAYPIISSGKDLEMKIKFRVPNSDEGSRLQKSFDKYIKEGEPFSINDPYIETIELSEWWEKWFGDYEKEGKSIQFDPIELSKPVLFSITLNPIEGDIVSFNNLEFYLIKGGTDYIEFSNDRAIFPIRFTLGLRKIDKKINMSIEYAFRDVAMQAHELLQLLSFFKAMSLGGKVLVKIIGNHEDIYTGEYPPHISIKPNKSYIDLIDKLCRIQNSIGEFFTIPNLDISIDNLSSIQELDRILNFGYMVFPNSEFSLQVKDNALEIFAEKNRNDEFIHMRLSTAAYSVELFDKIISVGPMVRDITGKIKYRPDEFDNMVKSASKGEYINVEFDNCLFIEYYSDWANIPLGELLAQNK